MSETATIQVFIFARGGSKGIPNKNIYPLAGKPLIAHSIDVAKQIDGLHGIYVSTDSPEIAKVAEEYGAEVIFRPDSLATDKSNEWLSWQHAVNTLVESGKMQKTDIFLSLPATAPLRNLEDIKKVIALYNTEKFDAVLTGSEAKRNPYFNMVVRDDQGMASIVMDAAQNIDNKEVEKAFHRRQDCPPVYDLTTVAYAVNPEFILTNKAIFDGNVGVVIVPEARAVDIDTPLDMAFAEFLIQRSE